MNKPLATVLLLASVSTLGACSREAPEELPPLPTDTVPTSNPTPSPTGPSGPTVGSQEHFQAAVGGSTV
ncbi:MAG: peptidoglycan-associated lipoprotein, partial [Pseudomonadota bacterium]